MHTDKAQVVELILEDGRRLARISCPSALTPSTGQFVLAGDASHSDLLPVPLFSTESTPSGFIACHPIPDHYTPGMEIILRGPLGSGFSLPAPARKVALISFDDSAGRLRGLIQPAFKQGAAVVLVSDGDDQALPDEVEVQPLSALKDILGWADYSAFDVSRENLPELLERIGGRNQLSVGKDAQVLVRAPLACGGIAECGVCAVSVKSNWKVACKDGPVFYFRELV